MVAIKQTINEQRIRHNFSWATSSSGVAGVVRLNVAVGEDRGQFGLWLGLRLRLELGLRLGLGKS